MKALVGRGPATNREPTKGDEMQKPKVPFQA
jgi:hypothetical protein